MNAEQLWETTMDPSFKNTSGDNRCYWLSFLDVDGDEVPPRREFIEKMYY
jgi:DNA gyrase subunit B